MAVSNRVRALVQLDGALNDAWPGVHAHVDYQDDERLLVRLRAPEALLLEHGLVSPADLGGIAPGGTARLGRLLVKRRKLWTRLELTADDGQHPAADQLEGRVLEVLLAPVRRPGIREAR
jgi:hypothetical protein